MAKEKKINQSTVVTSEQLVSAIVSLCNEDVRHLKRLMSSHVRWVVDWKGDGVFTHTKLFGRSSQFGHAAVDEFFETLFKERKPVSVTVGRELITEEELIILGRIDWEIETAEVTGLPLSSSTDFSFACLLHADQIIRARFLTLPENHINSFIPEYQTSNELSVEQIDIVTRDFQKLYFDSYLLGRTWSETHWMGVPIFKCPLDLWIYQELISELQPDIIIETGTCAGGSALYLANICDLVNKGEIHTVDIQAYKDEMPQHTRVNYLLGSSTSDLIIDQLNEVIKGKQTVLVVLDSNHSCEHVYQELLRYADLVSVGSYMVVEDSNLNGHPTKPNYGPGPMEALERFLSEDDRFRIDSEREKLLVTWNPHGYLLKTKE